MHNISPWLNTTVFPFYIEKAKIKPFLTSWSDILIIHVFLLLWAHAKTRARNSRAHARTPTLFFFLDVDWSSHTWRKISKAWTKQTKQNKLLFEFQSNSAPSTIQHAELFCAVYQLLQYSLHFPAHIRCHALRTNKPSDLHVENNWNLLKNWLEWTKKITFSSA